MRTRTILGGCALAAAAAVAPAQMLPAPQNVLQLQSNGTVEVQQDLLQIVLITARDGTDPVDIQAQLRAALAAALHEAEKGAQPGQLDVRTGNFAIYPRSNRDDRITGWSGTAALVLEGRDFSRITQTAARIRTMTLATVSFGLSREQRAKVQADAQAQAIQRLQTKAAELANAFGFSGYSLREVAVSSNEPGFVPRMRMAADEAKVSPADAAPVEPGKSAVTVTISGTVQLR